MSQKNSTSNSEDEELAQRPGQKRVEHLEEKKSDKEDDAIQAKVDQEDDPQGEVIQKIAHDKVKEQTHVIIKKLENHMD